MPDHLEPFTITAVMAMLDSLLLPHHESPDCWYSCPKSDDGCCDESRGNNCTCGAEDHNTKVNELRAILIAGNQEAT